MSSPKQSDADLGNGPPYEELHIYYIEGRVPRDVIFGSSYIGNWFEDGFSFLFFTQPELVAVKALLHSHPDLSLLDQYQMPYEQWQGGRIEAFEIGGFVVFPPWEQPTEDESGGRKTHPLKLDPGVVFGTGTHPTTRDCLEALELAITARCPDANIQSVLDLGTGTGLLALAAAKLGCSRVVAVDINFLAAKTALNNVRLNGLSNTIGVVQGRAEDLIDAPADLVVANIHYDVMRHLIGAPGFLSHRRFILSGLLRTQARQISDALALMPVTIHRTWQKDETWYTYYGEINNEGW